MKDYYDYPHSCTLHPGGWKLTRYAVEKCNFNNGAKLCDIGCGRGDTVDKLISELGFAAVGIEPSVGMNGGRADIISASADSTGLETEETDGVLFECVLSLTPDPKAALCEANRILKSGGKLIISDFYADNGFILTEGPVKRVFAETEIIGLVKECGFDAELFEDHTHEMITMAMQMIMDGADNEMCGLFSCLKKMKSRYFLLVAKKVR